MHTSKFLTTQIKIPHVNENFHQHLRWSIEKHAYSNILKISPPKTESFQTKILIFFMCAPNIDYGYSSEPPCRGGSNEYPQYMLLSRNKKNNVYPCKPQFYYINWGLRGSKLYRYVFVMRFSVIWYKREIV